VIYEGTNPTDSKIKEVLEKGYISLKPKEEITLHKREGESGHQRKEERNVQGEKRSGEGC